VGFGGFEGPPGGIVSLGRSFVFMGSVGLFRAGDSALLSVVGWGRFGDFAAVAGLAGIFLFEVVIRSQYALVKKSWGVMLLILFRKIVVTHFMATDEHGFTRIRLKRTLAEDLTMGVWIATR